MSGEEKLDMLAIGFYVGDEYFEKYTQGDIFPQVAAFKLEKRFLKAFLWAGFSVEVKSTVAVSTYPKGKKIMLPGSTHIEGGMHIEVVPFINVPFVKLLSRGLSLFRSLLKGKRKVRFVCVYSAHLPNLVSAYLYSRLVGVPFFVYIPDLPRFMAASTEGFVRVFFRKLNAHICELLVSVSAGIFVVTKYIPADVVRWRKLPFMVLEGIADESCDALNQDQCSTGCRTHEQPSRSVVFYAGGVTKKYGVMELVEGFLQADLNAELWICGRGDLEDYLKAKAGYDSRVKYFGFVSPDEVSRLQSMASCLVITRDPEEAYTRYSFPSKLIEYMASGKPVLTTFLEGIPVDYYDYLIEIKRFSAGGVCDALSKFFLEEGEAIFRARLGRAWVLQRKNPQAFGFNIRSFLEATLD